MRRSLLAAPLALLLAACGSSRPAERPPPHYVVVAPDGARHEVALGSRYLTVFQAYVQARRDGLFEGPARAVRLEREMEGEPRAIEVELAPLLETGDSPQNVLVFDGDVLTILPAPAG